VTLARIAFKSGKQPDALALRVPWGGFRLDITLSVWLIPRSARAINRRWSLGSGPFGL